MQDKRNENNQLKKTDEPNHVFAQGQENVVNKSYLEKKFQNPQFQFQIEDSIVKYSLNEAQERAFCIVANHAVSPCSELGLHAIP